MAGARIEGVLRHIRDLAAPQPPDGRDDELLRAFTTRGDEAAFAALVRRHGPLVLGVCRRALGSLHDAEDAFQATFLLLARNAASIRKAQSLASWLHGVALRIAADIRKAAARRRKREAQASPTPPANPAWEAAWREVQTLLDEEIGRLPETYRAPFVLCCLENLSRAEAACQLGLKEGTVWSRLAQARHLLRRRLARRGVTLSALLAAVALSRNAAPAAVSRAVVAATVRAVVDQGLNAGSTTTRAAALAEGAMRAMTMTRLKAAATALLVVGVFGAGAGLATRQVLAARLPAEPPPTARPAEAPQQQPPEGRTQPPGADHYARRLWAVTDVVLQNHLNPPPRGDMLLAGAQALLEAAGVTPPADFRRRVAEANTREQLQAALEAVWPRPGGGRDLAPEKLDAALSAGLLASIPGGPTFLTADYLKVVDQLAGNRYVGIGIQIRANKDEQYPQIVNPFRGGPAHRAGARPGDLIVEVDGRTTHGIELQKAVEWLRGEEGTPVTVVVRQPKADESRTLPMTRGVVPIDSVLGYRRAADGRWQYRIDPSDRIGYVRLNAINSSTLHELRRAEAAIRAEGVRALVLDLRAGAGQGELHHTDLLADGLLDGGLMWRLRGAGGRIKEYRADRECLFRGWPLAVLVDGQISSGTYGAFIAALQDNGRAVLVGEPTQYDGSVKSAVRLPDGWALVLPTGVLERAADGRGWPVQPDHLVKLDKAQGAAVEQWLRQKELTELPAGADDRPPDDAQLRRAVELLRPLNNASPKRR
jgi:C-terminal peptidase prc